MTPWHPRSITATDGFTLLEALVATALMATILAALATITAQWLPNWNRGMTRVQHSERIALALERFSADLAAAEFIREGGEPRRVVFDGTAHSVTFVRPALGPNTKPGLQIVRIAENHDPRGPMWVRMSAPFHPAVTSSGLNHLVFTDPVVLLRTPYRVSLSYAGVDRTWRELWRQQLQLPKAVRFTLRNVANKTLVPTSAATLIQADIPIDCLAAKSLSECFTLHLRPSAAGGKTHS
jgi:general secretion pathway protein J